MKFFKNRFVAKCLLFLTIFGVTPLVAMGELEDKVQQVEQVFYEYRGIHDRLDARSDAAENLMSIATQYPAVVSETESLRFAQKELYDDLWDYDIEDLYDANEELEIAFQALYQALLKEDLSETDTRAVESYSTTFNGAQRMIDSSDYNDRVRSFRVKTLSGFPARIFADMFDIDPPEYYGDPNQRLSDEGESKIERPEAPEAPLAPDVPDIPDVPDLDETIDNFKDGIKDYVSKTVSDALDDAFED